MTNDMSQLLNLGLESVLYLVLPIVAVIGVVGILGGVLQAATSVRDSASIYGIKIVALVLMLYFMLPVASIRIQTLMYLALGVSK